MANNNIAPVSVKDQKTNSFMAMGRFEYLQQPEPKKVNPFEESTKMYPGGIFTA